MKQRKKHSISCSICRKFISYKEIKRKQVKVLYIPDSDCSTEQTDFEHIKCLTKQQKTNE